MKLKSIHIKSFKHLQNIDFDFTYPEGHAKFGQPLEKICIIGQGATGKTSILELIKDSISRINSVQIVNNQFFLKHFESEFNGQLDFIYSDQLVKITKNTINFGGLEYKNISEPSGSVTIYVDGDYISKSSEDQEAKNLIRLLKRDDAALANERKRYVKRKREEIETYGITAKTFFETMIDEQVSLSYPRAIREEFNVDVLEMINI